MTECERLVAAGVFSPDFFREETRCDFLVTTERKKIWAVELDLLMQFDRVCRKHGLRYFMFVGSLLGAIRHRGFVPWDDDIDLVLPRDDYETMLKLGDEFPAPYFLQSPWTDKSYFFSFAKFRNSATSFVSEKLIYEDFDQGLMIDFHPLDAWMPDEGEGVYDEIIKLAYDNSTFMRMRNPCLDAKDLQRIREYKGIDPMAACEKMRELGMKWHGQDTKYVCRNTMGIYGYRRNLFLAEDFRSEVMWDFEGLKVPVPVGYERVLTTLYGDYMKFPPKEKRAQWHDGHIIDADVPWRECVARHRRPGK